MNSHGYLACGRLGHVSEQGARYNRMEIYVAFRTFWHFLKLGFKCYLMYSICEEKKLYIRVTIPPVLHSTLPSLSLAFMKSVPKLKHLAILFPRATLS